MTITEKEYLAELVTHAADTRSLLSSKRKSERERMVVRATLRMLDIPFMKSEIVANPEQNSDIDVFFRSAQFQVKDITGGRKRGDEWREKERQWQAAQNIEETGQPDHPSVRISFDDTLIGVAKALGAKLYGDRSKLDALVYVDVNRHIYPAPSGLRFVPPAELVEQGWRSVTMLFLPYAAVLTANADAPEELREHVGRLYVQTDAYVLDTLFEE